MWSRRWEHCRRGRSAHCIDIRRIAMTSADGISAISLARLLDYIDCIDDGWLWNAVVRAIGAQGESTCLRSLLRDKPALPAHEERVNRLSHTLRVSHCMECSVTYCDSMNSMLTCACIRTCAACTVTCIVRRVRRTSCYCTPRVHGALYVMRTHTAVYTA